MKLPLICWACVGLLTLPICAEALQLEIHGCNCKDLAKIYTQRLNQVKGVNSARITHRKGNASQVSIQYDPESTSPKQLRNWFERHGMFEKAEEFSDGASGLIPGAAQDGFRTWTDVKGRSLNARLLSRNGENVVIQTRNFQQHRLPISKFSEQDQAFIEKQFPAAAGAGGKAKASGELVVRVRELMCAGAASHIEAIYEKVPGVRKVDILSTNRQKAEGEAKVSFDATRTDRDTVLKQLKQVSYVMKVID